jgi:hypothetical protein
MHDFSNTTEDFKFWILSSTGHLIKVLAISICDMYFYPRLVHGELQFPNRAKIRSDSWDITMLPEP